MKLYTFYTPSHKVLYENHFLPSLPKGEFELDVSRFPQECPTGNFHAAGWHLTMRRKVDLVIRSIQECWGSTFIHSDCDVQFFRPAKAYFLEQLGGLDMALQDDVGQNCAGFFICRANDRTITLFRTIRKRLGRFSNDQMALNHYLHAQKVPFKKFDGRVYTVGQTIHKRWEGEPVKVPDNIIVHHANYTVGVNNKIKLMNMVRNQVAPKKRQRVKA